MVYTPSALNKFTLATVLVIILIIDLFSIAAATASYGEEGPNSEDNEEYPSSGDHHKNIIKLKSMKLIQKRNTKHKSRNKSPSENQFVEQNDAKKEGFRHPRKKGEHFQRSPMGTFVKIPNIHNLSSYDAILIDLVDEAKTTTTTTTTTTPQPTTTDTPSLIDSKEDTESSKVFIKKPDGNDGGRLTNNTGSQSGSMKNIRLVQGKQPEVVSKSGVNYRGKILNVGGKDVYAFYGIPYAAVPLGDLRFSRPFPPLLPPRGAVFEATKINLPCFPTMHGQTSSSAAAPFKHREALPLPLATEDCLYLNIWIPAHLNDTSKESELSPVLVWIHGEGFLSGLDHEDYKSAAFFVAETNIIVVTIQYRLGVFGFLDLGTEAQGNAGLHDQIQALQWIDENIEYFGGNPNSVTIMGHDVGASFVGIHLISKISPSFFKRAVMLGGSPTQPQVFQSNNAAKLAALDFARELGCVNSQSVKAIMECLKNVDAAAIWDVQLLFHSDPLSFPFVASEDDYIIDDDPLELLETGRGKICQVMIGGTSNEGTMGLLQYDKGMSMDKPSFISYDKFIRILNHVFRKFGDLELDAILHQYKNWGDPDDGFVNQLKLADAIGDHFVTCPLRQFSDAWSGRGLNTYHFMFSEKSSAFNRSKWAGVVHGNEVDFFFGVPLHYPDKFSPEEVDLSRRIIKMLADFVKTGVPSSDWERYGRETPIYMNLNSANHTLASAGSYGPRAEECGFWNEFFPKLRSMHTTRLSGNSAATDSSPTYSIDEHCVLSLQNCTSSSFSIYVNGIKK